MSLLDLIKRPFERMGTNLENYMGGLLGEDVGKMSPEERRRLRQRAIMAISEGMATMTPVSATLREAAGEEMARRQKAAQRREQEQRMGAAQQTSGQIAGRLMGAPQLFGRTKEGEMTSIYDTPAQQQAKIEADIAQQRASGQLQDVTPTARYIRDPQDALRMAMTPAGVDAMQINPFLQPALQEAMKPPAPTNYEFRNVEGVGLFAINPTNPADMRLLQAEKKDVPAAQPQIKTVQLGEGMVQDQWVLPGESSGTPLGVKYKSDGAKPLSSELTSRVVLAQSLRDSEIEIARLNPNIATEFWATAKPERMRSAELKQYEAAAKRWAANLLYFKSGAQAGQDEIESTWQQFFPLAGDDAATIAAKNRARLQEMTSVQNALNMSGVNINLATPYPVIKSENSEAYKSLKSGDVYMDSDGNYRTKK